VSFVHLRVHTEFSLTDSIIRVEPPKRKGGGAGSTLTKRVGELGQPAVAVTDRMNVFCAVKFYKGAEGAGIKPIVGADLWLRGPDNGSGEFGPSERLTLLVQSELGYRNLCVLLSRAYMEGQDRNGALLLPEWLAENHEGLIALTGRDGPVFRHALARQVEPTLQRLDELRALFGDRLYLEVSRCNRPGDEDWVQAARAIGRLRQVPLVATNDVRFLSRSDFETHEARVCISQSRVLADDKRPRDYTEEQYLKSAEEMVELFADLPEAIENTLQVARRCSITMSFGTYYLPDFPVPEGHDAVSWLRHRAQEGLSARLAKIELAATEEQYRERLEYELGIIERMKFPGYFLVVADFIEWAKHNGCPVGPGRGSGAGSLVAYSMGITDLDPLPYNLLFERFLNPERVSMPDFDIDFCMDNRDRVIEYVTQKYGRPHVSQIITYATMAARGVVRDVCRIMGHSFGFGDRIAKLIPGTPGATLADAVEEVPELKKAFEEEEDVRAVLELALELEGVIRGVGVHAGGVVIAPRPLVEYVPLFCEPGAIGVRTQYDMKDLELVGLVKFDFLGLKTLTVIKSALDLINPKLDKPLDPLEIPLTDTATYDLYASGDTTAVFQMESPGMQKASRDLRPDRFEDIIALVSLYRPGPMDLIPSYCARKRGDEDVVYLHPEMEPVLEPTYGIFVYQEQVMQMSQRLAGYTLGGADLLRRAMGKKKADEMAKQRVIFSEGAASRGINEETSGAVFDLMEKFANYGFNKSHAAAYALVSYHTAWLKTHYPAEFMAGVMSCEMDHTETVVTMYRECQRMQLTVHPPDINRSYIRFTVPAPGEIAYGLGAIKGVGTGALEGIIAERDANGPYQDLFDFCARIDLKKVNKRVLEAMVHAGAFDRFGLNRPSLLKTLPLAMQVAEKASSAVSTGISDMFGLGDAGATANAGGHAVEPEIVPDWSKREHLENERNALGFYLSGHPIEAYDSLLASICSARLHELVEQQEQQINAVKAAAADPNAKPVWSPRQKHLFGAWVTDIRFFKGDKLAGSRVSYKITLADKFRQISTWIDGDPWARYAPFVKVDSLVFLQAEVGLSSARDGREPEPRLYNADFLSLDQVMAEYASRISLDWHNSRGAHDVVMLRRLLEPARDPNGAPASIVFANRKASAQLDLSPQWRLRVSTTLLEQLRGAFGAESVKVVYKSYAPPVVERRSEKAFAPAGDGE